MKSKIDTVYRRVIFSFLLFSSLLFPITLSAKNVTLETASQVAFNVFSEKSGVTKSLIEIKEVIPVKNGDLVLYRIFNFSPKGYIVITADDNVRPVIGYGLNSNFSFDNAPPALLYLLGEYKEEMEYIIENKLKADDSITAKWQKFSSEDYVPLKSYTVGTKLLETNWNQGSPYNNSCPLDPNTGNRCLVGCTAVALGQILNYWECKVFPDGTRTYYPNVYFTNPLTVNFYDQNYTWNDIGTEVAPTAEFLYHCGVAIRVNYTDSATSGYSSYVEQAMRNNFGFQTTGLKSKNSYSASTWIDMLKADINAGRPIYYDGTNTTVTPNTAHAWVIDGYKSTNEFHCNWGWGGTYNDTWYYLTNLTPPGHNYNSNQRAILGAKPILDACSGLLGASTICYPDTVQYAVTIPSTASVTWSNLGNLAVVGSSTNLNYYVRSTSNSSTSGTITANIKNSQGQTFLTRTKTVWLGTPLPGISPLHDPSCYYCQVSYGQVGIEYMIAAQTDNPSTYMYDYQWEIYGPGDEEGYADYGKQIYYAPPAAGTFTFKLKQNWTCGWSDFAQVERYVYGGYRLLFSPNPTTGETTLTIESVSEAKMVDEIVSWELDVYDNAQNLKLNNPKVKGKECKFDTSGWKEGVYIVRVKYKDEILTGKLVVKQ